MVRSGRPRGSGARGVLPSCPRDGHDGSAITLAGRYGKPTHRRQLYRCEPSNGDPAHRFSGVLPRQCSVSGRCEECEHTFEPFEGPGGARHYDFTARQVAKTLAALARGVSYRGAGADIRRSADRLWLRGGVPVSSRHGMIACDWVEVFAPVIWSEYEPNVWPDTLVVDLVPFKRNFTRNGRPVQSGKFIFAVFGALGYINDEPHLWRLEALSGTRQEHWEQFLRAHPNAPSRVVCDGAPAIANAVRAVWPGPTPANPTAPPTPMIWNCEYHLRALGEKKLRERGLDHHNRKIWKLMRTAFATPEDWQNFADEADRYRIPELDRWVAKTGEILARQMPLRAPGVRLTTGGLEGHLRRIKNVLKPRASNLRNRKRTNRLLSLMCLEANSLADERRWAELIRTWLEANEGRPAQQRQILDKANRKPSLWA